MKSYLSGLEVLLQRQFNWIRRARVGLVAHPASVGSDGTPSPVLLRQAGVALTCLLGPEHGYHGRGGAGEEIGHQRHPEWDIPIHSLYGDTRKPTTAMLDGVEVVIFDLQDLGARPYTFVSTLRHVLEAAAEQGKTVIVADRPIPLPDVVDGPVREDALESFVGFVRTPVAYGMTPAEAALWIRSDLGLDVDLRVAPMEGFSRTLPWADWLPWVPPSPAITSIESACCFPMTVFLEALPALDHARKTSAPFQMVGAPWLDGVELARRLNLQDLPGVRFHAQSYTAMAGEHAGQLVRGVRMEVSSPGVFRPVLSGMALLSAVQDMAGQDRLWLAPGTREDFFDKLMGSDQPRLALKAGEPAERIASAWEEGLHAFSLTREPALLYS